MASRGKMNPRHHDLLAALPTQEYALFFPHLELVSHTKGQVLFETGEVPPYVYFPVGAVVSIICELDGKQNFESNMVGRSSMVGLTNTGLESFYKAEVRSSGLSYRIHAHTFRQLRKQCPVFVEALTVAQAGSLRYTSFTGACSRHHPIDQQILRWMLISLDCGFQSSIEVTHAELSRLLGFRREAITLTLGKLVESGSIKLGRGEIEVIDRAALENQACECYWRIANKKRLSFTSLVNDEVASAHSPCK
jgi:CRP-like cAMP-binding protein